MNCIIIDDEKHCIRTLTSLLETNFPEVKVLATCLDSESKLKILASHLLKSAKRVFGIPDFRYYALSDGVHNVLKNCSGIFYPHHDKPPGQFLLALT